MATGNGSGRRVLSVDAEISARRTLGLSSQLQRAAVSVPSNIAEGHGRRHRGDFVRQLSIASGSVKEVETQALISVRLGYASNQDIATVLQLCEAIGKMLAGLIRKLG